MDIQKAINNEYTATANLGRVDIPEEAKPYVIELLALRKELHQYRQIGTLEECKAAREKQVAKEPQFHISEFQCPNCGMENLEEIDDLGHIYLIHKYCPDCGQALKWGD